MPPGIVGHHAGDADAEQFDQLHDQAAEAAGDPGQSVLAGR